MVFFTKNHKEFKFDYEALAEYTSKEFSTQVLNYTIDSFVESVDCFVYANKNVGVTVLNDVTIVELYFFAKDKKFEINIVGRVAVERLGYRRVVK